MLFLSRSHDFFDFTNQIILPSTSIHQAYANGFSEEQAFIQNLALFLTSFYKSHIRVLETTQQNIAALLMGLEYLINIPYMDDTEVFKLHHNLDNPAAAANMMGLQI
ncbi:protein EXPORTIN 1A [Prunus yedoensis var. nudiflora]|uniref:Protein EXPORTIN 1A n=1 Tax=Prunus yedoensis var. nudiflora TaxID=2094558 RepID=A0A314XNI6_PRUYE|nr:protein EXPORTIN 1A [Prunus yedoensis var. nudiflora]